MNKDEQSNANPKLSAALKEVFSENPEVSLLSVATTDGFSIKAFAKKSLGVELDKMAAMSSSLYALSNSSALQLTDGEATITTIESEMGNILLMSSEFFEKQCVITMVATTDMSLAQARFYLTRLSKTISEIE